jgi:regulator of RNase E activity RraA
LRVADVCDALDGIGFFDITLMAPEIRPLQSGIHFWGVAFTMRCVRPIAHVEAEHDRRDRGGARNLVRAGAASGHQLADSSGHVVVSDAGGALAKSVCGVRKTSLGVMECGAVGIVTSGHCRDTRELALQKHRFARAHADAPLFQDASNWWKCKRASLVAVCKCDPAT